MSVTASKLREDVYHILDTVLETGEPVEITRKGRILRIIAVEIPATTSRLEKLAQRAASRAGGIIGNPENLVDIEWSGEWKPEI